MLYCSSNVQDDLSLNSFRAGLELHLYLQVKITVHESGKIFGCTGASDI